MLTDLDLQHADIDRIDPRAIHPVPMGFDGCPRSLNVHADIVLSCESQSTLSNQLIKFYVDDPVFVNGESGKPHAAMVVGVSGKQHVTGQYKLTNSTGEPLQAGDTVPASYFEGAKNDKIIYSPTPAIGANGGNGHIISVNPDGTYAIALEADAAGHVLDNIIPAEIAIIIDTSNPPKPKILSNIPRANLRLDFAALPNARVCEELACPSAGLSVLSICPVHLSGPSVLSICLSICHIHRTAMTTRKPSVACRLCRGRSRGST